MSAVAGPGSKVGTGAVEALRDVLADGQLIAVGGFGLCGIPVDLIEAVRDSGVRDLTDRVQQHGRGRQGPRRAARVRPGAQGSGLVRGGEQAVRRPVPGRAARGGVQPAGHAGRAAAGRRRGHPGLLHRDRRGHGDRRGQAARRLRRADLSAGARHRRRRGPGARVPGRPGREPAVPAVGAQLQPAGGRGGQGHRGGGRGDRRSGRDRPGPGAHARASTSTPWWPPDRRPRRSRRSVHRARPDGDGGRG